MLRNALWAVLGLAAFLAGSCADGAEEPQSSGDASMCLATCNNGIKEAGEACENVVVGTMLTTDPALAPSCAAMGMGLTGVVLCDPCLCMWSYDNCSSSGTGGVGGGSAM